ncbi:reverse transcriptase domain-containing protein [Tanacetum coccineum]|uniref:Reverse transcriptase domain-containing protein n=1 Tax=Tanacetum coccineum TaxID=301880 RepID=A0ABQ5IXQ1_9ASTR
MEEIIGKFIDEGKKEHEEMETFIREFRTTNKILLKEQNNLLSELRIEVHRLLRVMNDVMILQKEVKGVTTRGGRMTIGIAYNDDINNINKEAFELPHDKPKEPRDVILRNEPQKTKETISQPSAKVSRIPIILGRPFLATARAMIDVFNKKITLRVGDYEVIFDMDQSMKNPPSEDEECFSIDELDGTIHKETQELLEKDQSDSFLLKNLEKGVNQLNLDNCSPEPDKIISDSVIRRIDYVDTAYSGEQQNDGPDKIRSEHLYLASANEIGETKPELKSLPSHLEYSYLNGDESFPVIISSKLSKKEKKSLLQFIGQPDSCCSKERGNDHGFFQIPIAPEDQEKTTFTLIFHDMVEDFMEVFMDDFLVFGNSFDNCLVNLDKMLARCEETNLVLNLEECHFMVSTVVYTDHSALKYLFNKYDAKPRLIRWVLLLQGFNIEIKDKKGGENFAAYHLSRLENPNIEVLIKREIADEFPDEHSMMLKAKLNDGELWYADYINYIIGKVVPTKWSAKRKRRFYSQVKNYSRDEPYAFKLCVDNVMRRCAVGSKILEILAHCHSGLTGGHHSASITRRKVYESSFFWPNIFKDAKNYVMRCDACQRLGNITSRSEIPQNNIQICEVFDVWGLDFMGPFPYSRAQKALQKYGVTHKLSTTYHPQSNGQIEVTNRAIKRILERSVGYNPKDWMVYGKACHLPVEIEHKAYWALKQCNMDLTGAAKNHFMELNELAELRDGAYENNRIYKERTKRWHDSRL